MNATATTLIQPNASEARQRWSFAGHETFTFRHGWLKKGHEAQKVDPGIFTTEEAMVRLGVGKNMVASIRHWLLAMSLAEETNGRGVRATDLGSRLLDDDGWDPYLENPATLWLLHWQLVSNPARSASWHLAFAHFNRHDFTKAELQQFILSFVERNGIHARTASLDRDVECCLRTYLPAQRASGAAEETFDCPLVELSLVQPRGEKDTYRFVVGAKPSLAPEVFGYALATFAAARALGRQLLSVQECLFGVGSPGMAFKLDENALIDLVDEVSRLTDGAVAFDETAGLRQVFFREALDPLSFLERMYGAGA